MLTGSLALTPASCPAAVAGVGSAPGAPPAPRWRRLPQPLPPPARCSVHGPPAAPHVPARPPTQHTSDPAAAVLLQPNAGHTATTHRHCPPPTAPPPALAATAQAAPRTCAPPHCASGATRRPIRRCSTVASPPSSPLSRKEAARLAPAALNEGAAPTARLALYNTGGGEKPGIQCTSVAGILQGFQKGHQLRCLRRLCSGLAQPALPHLSVDTICAWYSSSRRAPSTTGSAASPKQASTALMRRTPRGRRACRQPQHECVRASRPWGP